MGFYSAKSRSFADKFLLGPKILAENPNSSPAQPAGLSSSTCSIQPCQMAFCLHKDHGGRHKNRGTIDLFVDSISGIVWNRLCASFRPKCSVHMAVLNALESNQIELQVVIARTLETPNIDTYCFSKIRIRYPVTIITLRSPDKPLSAADLFAYQVI